MSQQVSPAAARSHGTELVASDVSKRFDADGRTTVALDDVSITLRPGEFVSLVGPSGCGKSTLLRLFAGLEAPSAGSIVIGAERVGSPNSRTGVVFQKPALFPWLDVIDNVMFGPRMQGRGGHGLREQAVALLAAVGLSGFEHHKVYQLSGGMQHRVSLARVLINRPDLLLMDEPFASLDAQTRLTMQELLLQMWDADRSTVFFITHDVDEALLLSERVVVMTARPGRIKAIYEVGLPRPRDLSVITSDPFTRLKATILESIRAEIQVEESRETDALRSAVG
jgi:ABC-type nitrate/sulfonate/bicarbonate transport system ATPase subunit